MQRRPPDVVMSGHVGRCLNHSNELRECGATQFIAKPFPTEDRTLASVIRDVLATHEQQSAQETSRADNGKPGAFHTDVCYEQDDLYLQFPAEHAIALAKQLQMVECRRAGW